MTEPDFTFISELLQCCLTCDTKPLHSLVARNPFIFLNALCSFNILDDLINHRVKRHRPVNR